MTVRAIICYHLDAVVAGGGLQYSVDTARFWLKKGIQVHVLTSNHPRTLLDLEKYRTKGQLVIHEVSDMNRLLLTHEFNEEVHEKAARVFKEIKPEMIQIHNFHGLIGAVSAAVESPAETVYCALDFGFLCLNWCLYDGSPVPCSGPEPKKCRTCMLTHYQPSKLKQSLARLPVGLLKWIVKNPRYFKQHALIKDYFEKAGEHLDRMLSLLKRFDRILTMSPITGELFQKFGVSKEKIIYQVYGVPFAAPDNNHKKDDSKTTLLFLGHMGPTKGFYIIAQALERLPTNLKLHIKLYGPEAQEFVSTCGVHLRPYLSAHPTLVGSQNEEALSESDGVLVPSQWHENSPYAVLRCLAAGRPVLASKQNGITHLITNGRNGFLIEPADIDAWASLLHRVADDPSLLRAMRRHCSYTKSANDYCQEIEAALSS